MYIIFFSLHHPVTYNQILNTKHQTCHIMCVLLLSQLEKRRDSLAPSLFKIVTIRKMLADIWCLVSGL